MQFFFSSIDHLDVCMMYFVGGAYLVEENDSPAIEATEQNCKQGNFEIISPNSDFFHAILSLYLTSVFYFNIF